MYRGLARSIALFALASLPLACGDDADDSGTGGDASTSDSGTTALPTTSSTSSGTSETSTSTTADPTTSSTTSESTTSDGTSTGDDSTTSGTGSTGGTTGGQLPGAEEIYIADLNNNRIVRIDDLTGTNWTVYDTNLDAPRDVALDGAGRIYIACQGSDEIVRIDDMAGANRVSFSSGFLPFGSPPGASEQLDLLQPFNIAVGPDGTIYVSDNNFRILHLDAIPPTWWNSRGQFGFGANEFQTIADVFVDASGMYVVDSTEHHLVFMGDFADTTWVTFGTQGIGDGQFTGPIAVAIADNGHFFVVDRNNERVVEVELSLQDDVFTMQSWESYDFGVSEDLADVALAPNGEIYVTESNLVSIFGMTDISGTDFVSYGDPGAGDDQFAAPWGIAVR